VLELPENEKWRAFTGVWEKIIPFIPSYNYAETSWKLGSIKCNAMCSWIWKV
jgi:hypothetical protein